MAFFSFQEKNTPTHQWMCPRQHGMKGAEELEHELQRASEAEEEEARRKLQAQVGVGQPGKCKGGNVDNGGEHYRKQISASDG